jgi:hypothetical protein
MGRTAPRVGSHPNFGGIKMESPWLTGRNLFHAIARQNSNSGHILRNWFRVSWVLRCRLVEISRTERSADEPIRRMCQRITTRALATTINFGE